MTMPASPFLDFAGASASVESAASELPPAEVAEQIHSSDVSGSPVDDPRPHGASLQQGLATSSNPSTAAQPQRKGSDAAYVAKPEVASDRASHAPPDTSEAIQSSEFPNDRMINTNYHSDPAGADLKENIENTLEIQGEAAGADPGYAGGGFAEARTWDINATNHIHEILFGYARQPLTEFPRGFDPHVFMDALEDAVEEFVEAPLFLRRA